MLAVRHLFGQLTEMIYMSISLSIHIDIDYELYMSLLTLIVLLTCI